VGSDENIEEMMMKVNIAVRAVTMRIISGRKPFLDLIKKTNERKNEQGIEFDFGLL
jgi:hypothetical protein